MLQDIFCDLRWGDSARSVCTAQLSSTPVKSTVMLCMLFCNACNMNVCLSACTKQPSKRNPRTVYGLITGPLRQLPAVLKAMPAFVAELSKPMSLLTRLVSERACTGENRGLSGTSVSPSICGRPLALSSIARTGWKSQESTSQAKALRSQPTRRGDLQNRSHIRLNKENT